MITSERGYKHTKATVEGMEAALGDYEARGGGQQLDPLMRQAVIDGMRSLCDEWREEMREYEALKAGRGEIRLRSLHELPDALVKARLAAGLTQRQLAERLGLKAQQIQRYEATRYRGVSLDRAHQVADALGLRWDATLQVGKS